MKNIWRARKDIEEKRCVGNFSVIGKLQREDTMDTWPCRTDVSLMGERG